jgi:hypothetical protein
MIVVLGSKWLDEKEEFVPLASSIKTMALLNPNVDLDPMAIGADTRDSCSEKRVKGDPAG